jgi:hypothetical protein
MMWLRYLLISRLPPLKRKALDVIEPVQAAISIKQHLAAKASRAHRASAHFSPALFTAPGQDL